jgi:hypothetical protein
MLDLTMLSLSPRGFVHALALLDHDPAFVFHPYHVRPATLAAASPDAVALREPEYG